MDYCSKLAITVVASFIFSLKLAIKNHMACLFNYGFDADIQGASLFELFQSIRVCILFI